MANLSAVMSSDAWELVPSTVAEEGHRDPAWRTRLGSPQRWALYDGDKIILIPSPTLLSQVVDPVTPGAYIIDVGYIQQPELLVADADTVDSRIPYSVQQYLKYAAASWLLSLDQSDTTSLQTASVYMQTFNQMIGG